MKNILWFLLLTITFWACEYEDDFAPDEFTNTPEQHNDGENGHTHDAEDGALTLYRVTGDAIDKIKDYPVEGNLLRYQQDEGRHSEMWDFVTRLLPLNERGKIAEFEVFFGDNDLLGYVAPIDDNDLSRWRFGLAIDVADNLSTIDLDALFTFVTIHEYAHVLTLNDSQVQVGGDEWSCNQFFTGEGCARPTSYINRFFDLGWADIYDEHNEDNPERTYRRYRDRFVSDYAATNPGEDIAEVISFFITEDEMRTGNSIADQKIQMMYTFPKLVELRDEIRSTVDVSALPARSLGTLRTFQGFRIGKHQAK